MVTLRDYQIDALNALDCAIKTQDVLLLQAATGAGKTIIVARFIQKYYKKFPDRKFLLLMHKKELIKQFQSTFANFTEIPAHDIGIACAGISQSIFLDRRIVIASVQTFINYLSQYPGADLVVVDETHRVSQHEDTQYQKVLARLREYKPRHKVLGVTATAYRLGHGMIYGDKCRVGNENFFPSLTHRITYKSLVHDGHLMPLKGFVCADRDTIAEIQSVKTSAGDYVMAAAGSVMSKHVESAVDAYEKYATNHKHVAVFACTINHAEALLNAFTSRGYDAVCIHSRMAMADRDENLRLWHSGEVRFAISVNILVEGFDFPALSCLIMARPTKSPVVFIQAIGRILRKSESKEEALLVDMTGNVKEFGLDIDNPCFTIPSCPKGEGEAPHKVCPGELADGQVCGARLHPAILECENCGYEFSKEEVNKALGIMEEIEFLQLEPPEWKNVVDMKVNEHISKNGKVLLRIKFELESFGYQFGKTVSMWLCFPDYYEGYAVKKSEEKWALFSEEPFPQSAEEAEFLADSIECPTRILCSLTEDGKHYNAIDFDFNPIETEAQTIEYGEVPF
jgi:DNA repair protein RadD